MSSSCGLEDEFSDQETGSHDNEAKNYNLFELGKYVYLSYPRHGVIGRAIVIEATPLGCWLGVNIDHTYTALTLVRPVELSHEAQSLLIHPIQEGVSVLADSFERTILWKTSSLLFASDVEDTSESRDTSLFAFQKDWMRKVVKRLNSDADHMASGRINCVRADDPFENGTVGEGYIGVTMLDVFLGDLYEIMTHQRSIRI